jgi:Flp pilus assembly protein TadG
MKPGQERRRDDGYSIVEAAIPLPAIVVLCMLVVQGALVWHARHVADAAARAGVDAARSYDGTSAAGRQAASSYVQDVAPHLVLGPSVTATRTGQVVSVQIHARVLRVVPLPGSLFSVTEIASGPVERFVASGERRGSASSFSRTTAGGQVVT